MTAVVPTHEGKARTDHPTPTGIVTPLHTCLNGKEPDDPPEGSVLISAIIVTDD